MNSEGSAASCNHIDACPTESFQFGSRLEQAVRRCIQLTKRILGVTRLFTPDNCWVGRTLDRPTWLDSFALEASVPLR